MYRLTVRTDLSLNLGSSSRCRAIFSAGSDARSGRPAITRVTSRTMSRVARCAPPDGRRARLAASALARISSPSRSAAKRSRMSSFTRSTCESQSRRWSAGSSDTATLSADEARANRRCSASADLGRRPRACNPSASSSATRNRTTRSTTSRYPSGADCDDIPCRRPRAERRPISHQHRPPGEQIATRIHRLRCVLDRVS